MVRSQTTGSTCTKPATSPVTEPILIMDVWEHAFIEDYAPVDRPKYIEAFFANINWDVVNSRLG